MRCLGRWICFFDNDDDRQLCGTCLLLGRSSVMMTTTECWRQTAAASTVSLGQYSRERVRATAGYGELYLHGGHGG